MEEPNPAQDPPLPPPQNPDHNPPTTGPDPPPQQQHPPPPPPRHSQSKKRPLDGNVHVQDCSFFKMRTVVRDMRPYLLEVLGTVDFRSCNGAHGLQDKLKLLMELYNQMISSETVTITKCKIGPEGQPLTGENGVTGKHQEQLQNTKPSDQPLPDWVCAKPSEKQQAEGGNGSYVVGGSAFGWNFITCTGNVPIYYGRTKESFRAANPTS